MVFDSEQYNLPLYYGSKLVQVATGASLGPINGHHEFDLAAGDYRVEVAQPGGTGTYWFTSYLKPDAQTFGGLS